MPRFRRCRLFCLAFAGLVCASGPALAQPPQAAPTRQQLGQWVMNYYKSPSPELVVERVRQLAELNILTAPGGNRPEAHQMFLGRVMAANPAKIATWMEAWKGLPEADQQVLRQGVWMSQTPEGTAWLKEHGHAELAERPPHPLLSGAPYVLEPYHLDMLWEWFFATGDEAPVLQIIGKYALVSEPPGDEKLPVRPDPNADRATQLRQTIGGAAVWSSSSLAMSHDRLLAILKERQSDPKLPPQSAQWLRRVIEIAEEGRTVKP